MLRRGDLAPRNRGCGCRVWVWVSGVGEGVTCVGVREMHVMGSGTGGLDPNATQRRGEGQIRA